MTRTLFAFLFVISIYACDEKPVLEATPSTEWALTQVYGGLVGVNITYSVGEVFWSFDSKTGTMIVENNIESTGPEQIYSGLSTGTYTYEIRDEGAHEVLVVNASDLGTIVIASDTLRLDDGLAADGFVKVFAKYDELSN